MTLLYIIIGIAAVILYSFFLKFSKSIPIESIEASELRKILQKVILIDVRTRSEIKSGVIGKPLKIELGSSMKQKFSALDKTKKYVVYCRSGRRSAIACNMMKKMGIENVTNLTGGINAWNSL